MNTGPGRAVVVGVDESDDSLRAVDWAAADAGRRHLPLHIVHACGPPRRRPVPPGRSLPIAVPRHPGLQTARLLATAEVRARDAAPDLEVSSEAIGGRPVPVLLTAARQADALVVGGRGSGGFAGLFAGSTATQVVDHASCPVVVVRPRAGPAGRNIGRIVLGVDGSPAAGAAARFAFAQAAWRGVGLTAVHAYEVPVALEKDGIQPLRYDQAAVRDAAVRRVAEAVAGLGEEYPDVEVWRDVVRGRPADVVITASAGAELVVVGARGHEGFAGLRLGSVSRAAVHHVRGPVAVVR